jgi:hypothetical protein
MTTNDLPPRLRAVVEMWKECQAAGCDLSDAAHVNPDTELRLEKIIVDLTCSDEWPRRDQELRGIYVTPLQAEQLTRAYTRKGRSGAMSALIALIAVGLFENELTPEARKHWKTEPRETRSWRRQQQR